MHSNEIGKLAEALCKAQLEMGAAKKDSVNPHFKSKYADLASVIDAIKEPFAKHGLSYSQSIRKTEMGIELVTILMHTTGQSLYSYIPLIIGKQDMQGLGSSLTYARRYALSAIAGLPQEDDDGNSANAKPDLKPGPKFQLNKDDLKWIQDTATKNGYTKQEQEEYFHKIGKPFSQLTESEYTKAKDHFSNLKIEPKKPDPDWENEVMGIGKVGSGNG